MRRRTVAAGVAGVAVAVTIVVAPPAPAPAAAPAAWGAEVAASTGPQPSFDSDVAVAPDGTAVAVFTTVLPADGAYHVAAATRPRGGSWSAPTYLSAAVVDDAFPQVVVDAAGGVTVAWRNLVVDQHSFWSTTRPAGGTWTAPFQVLADTPDYSYQFDLAVGAEGTAVLTWLSDDLGDQTILAARRLNGTWGLPVDLSQATDPADLPVALVGPSGTATVAWPAESGGSQLLRVATRPKGEAWSPPTVVAPVNPVIGDPALATTPDGSTWIAWPQFAGLGYQYNVSRKPVVGGWSPPEPITDLTSLGEDPALVAGADGTLALVWGRPVNGSQERVDTTLRSPDGVWSPVATLSQPFDVVSSVTAGIGPDGSVTAVWDGIRGAMRQVEAAIRHPGEPWGSTVTLAAPSGGSSALGIDAQGDGVATWDGGVATGYTVRSRVLDSGYPSLPPATIPATAYAGKPRTFTVPPPADAASDVTTSWDFGDGKQAVGTTVSHAYAVRGTYGVVVTATDAAGHGVVRTGSVEVTGKPALRKVRLVRHRLVRHGSPHLAKTKLAFTLTDPGKVVVRLSGPARAKLVLTGLTRGRHHLVLRTRIAGTQLTPGVYRVRLVGKNPAGTGKAKKVRLVVVPRLVASAPRTATTEIFGG